MITCSKGCQWSGTSRAHCGGDKGCHLTYNSPYVFDQHRRGGRCLTPEEAGLEERQANNYIYYAVPFTGTPYWGSDAATVDPQEQE